MPQIGEGKGKSGAFLQPPEDTERIDQSQPRKASIGQRMGDKGVVDADADRVVAEDNQLRKVHWMVGTGYWDCCVPSPAITANAENRRSAGLVICAEC